MFHIHAITSLNNIFSFKCESVPRVGELIICKDDYATVPESPRYKVDSVQYILEENKEECTWVKLFISQL